MGFRNETLFAIFVIVILKLDLLSAYSFRTNNAFVYYELLDTPSQLSAPLTQPVNFASPAPSFNPNTRRKKALPTQSLKPPAIQPITEKLVNPSQDFFPNDNVFLDVSDSNLKKMFPPAPVVFTDNNPGRSADLVDVGFTNTVTPSSNINQLTSGFVDPVKPTIELNRGKFRRNRNKARKRISKDKLFRNHQLPVEETQRHVSKPETNRIRFRKPVANQQFFHLGPLQPTTTTTTVAPIIEVTSFNNNLGFRHGKEIKETKEEKVADILARDPRFKKFSEALFFAFGNETDISALSPYTVFAATNEAFDAMNNEELQQMEDKSTAASILLKHIVVFDDVEIPYGQTAILSVADTEIGLVKPRNPRQTTKVRVGSKRGQILEQDITAIDGRIHAVDFLFL